jgi:hypothetical protein
MVHQTIALKDVLPFHNIGFLEEDLSLGVYDLSGIRGETISR